MLEYQWPSLYALPFPEILLCAYIFAAIARDFFIVAHNIEADDPIDRL